MRSVLAVCMALAIGGCANMATINGDLTILGTWRAKAGQGTLVVDSGHGCVASGAFLGTAPSDLRQTYSGTCTPMFPTRSHRAFPTTPPRGIRLLLHADLLPEQAADPLMKRYAKEPTTITGKVDFLSETEIRVHWTVQGDAATDVVFEKDEAAGVR